MATDVTLPQLGESVTEGTITAWLVEVGDTVEADQPLFELSSDKIDTEVPAPTGGVLTEIKVGVDETVDVGTVVAVIGEAGEGGGDAESADEEPADEEPEEGKEPEKSEEPEAGEDEAAGPKEERAEEAGGQASAEAEGGDGGGEDADDGKGALASPLVRKLAADADLELGRVKGSGEGGRITREDVETAIAAQDGDGNGKASAAKAPSGRAARSDDRAQQTAPQAKPASKPPRSPALPSGDRVRVEDLSRIRQRIAAKMMESVQSSAQLTTVQEADITGVMRLRDKVSDEFKAREGVSLSPFVFLCRAAVLALRNHPSVNAMADWDAAKVAFHEYVNLGIAVDTEKGLIVPNVKGADDLTLAGLARAIKEGADKARGQGGAGKLELSDIEGGTFTVTNTGSRGVLIDTPILNFPEVAILGTGAIKKRPVVLSSDTGDAIAVRDMVYLCLTYDHRLIDGADAARFVTDVAHVVETHDWAAEIGYADDEDDE